MDQRPESSLQSLRFPPSLLLPNEGHSPMATRGLQGTGGCTRGSSPERGGQPWAYELETMDPGTLLQVQWLRLRASSAGNRGSIPGRGSSTYCAVQPKRKKEETTEPGGLTRVGSNPEARTRVPAGGELIRRGRGEMASPPTQCDTSTEPRRELVRGKGGWASAAGGRRGARGGAKSPRRKPLRGHRNQLFNCVFLSLFIIHRCFCKNASSSGRFILKTF